MNPPVALVAPAAPLTPLPLPDVAHHLPDLAALLGLPTLRETARSTAAGDRLAWHARVGSISHAVIAAAIPTALSSDDEEQLRRRIHQEVERRSRGPRLGRPDRLRAVVTRIVVQYLSVYLPRDAEFLGAEMALGDQRVDLVWRCPHVGVFIDELKTWTSVPDPLDERTIAQLLRYLDAGMATFGQEFVGLRLLTLRQPTHCQWYRPDGLIEPLLHSPLAPARLTEGDPA